MGFILLFSLGIFTFFEFFDRFIGNIILVCAVFLLSDGIGSNEEDLGEIELKDKGIPSTRDPMDRILGIIIAMFAAALFLFKPFINIALPIDAAFGQMISAVIILAIFILACFIIIHVVNRKDYKQGLKVFHITPFLIPFITSSAIIIPRYLYNIPIEIGLANPINRVMQYVLISVISLLILLCLGKVKAEPVAKKYFWLFFIPFVISICAIQIVYLGLVQKVFMSIVIYSCLIANFIMMVMGLKKCKKENIGDSAKYNIGWSGCYFIMPSVFYITFQSISNGDWANWIYFVIIAIFIIVYSFSIMIIGSVSTKGAEMCLDDSGDSPFTQYRCSKCGYILSDYEANNLLGCPNCNAVFSGKYKKRR